MQEIIVAENINELNHNAADRFLELAGMAIKTTGRFTIALSGGSTPKSLYRLLSSDEYKNRIDWTLVFLFFGDERFVPADDPESNYRMARENLLDLTAIPAENVFRWHTESGSPEEVAANYDETIKDFFAGDIVPRFDLILLGLGEDGHTASLFPDSPALSETRRFAVSNWVEKLNAWRLTFTFPLINAAANIIFLVSGEKKADVLKKVLNRSDDSEESPASRIHPETGKLVWLVDSRAYPNN
jgi:6-phosphogluconolactonase